MENDKAQQFLGRVKKRLEKMTPEDVKKLHDKALASYPYHCEECGAGMHEDDSFCDDKCKEIFKLKSENKCYKATLEIVKTELDWRFEVQGCHGTFQETYNKILEALSGQSKPHK